MRNPGGSSFKSCCCRFLRILTFHLNDQEFPWVFKIIFDPLVADVEKRLHDLILTAASPDYHTVKIAQIYSLQQALS